jgi:hypothetical protein
VRSVIGIVKNVAAFCVTVIVGLVVGTALLTVDTVETMEIDVKKRIERHRSAGP